MSNSTINQNLSAKMKIAKAITQSLPKKEHRNLCHRWLDLLSRTDLKCSKIVQQDVLRLLSASIRGNHLVGPFLEEPEESKLYRIACRYQVSDIHKFILWESFKAARNEKVTAPLPVDKLCFAVFQLIPYFGGHYYYTTSSMNTRTFKDLQKMRTPIGATWLMTASCARGITDF